MRLSQTERRFLLRTARAPGREAAIDLRRRRAWFADAENDDDDTGGREGPTDQQGGNEPSSKYDPASIEEALKIIGALEKRIGEREAANDDLKHQLASVDEAQKKKLEEEGNYRELVKQHEAKIAALKPYQERAEALETMIRESNERRIETIPENRRQLVPTDYAPEKLSAWLDQNAPLLAKPQAPDIDAGAGGEGGGSSVTLTAEQRAMAKRMGMTDEQFVTAFITMQSQQQAQQG